MAANPVGRWYQRFQCPHCHKALQFDARTNQPGLVASALFVAAMLTAVMGQASWTPWFAGACGVLWAATPWLSYRLRGIVKA